VVHVLGEVLRKTHRSLRADGSVLVIQPTRANSLIKLEIGGQVRFSQELQMPNFLGYLEATELSLANAVAEGLFATELEATTPDEGQYHCSEYGSLEEWIEDWKPFCEDLDPFHAMSATIRNLVGREGHRVLEYYRQYEVLLRKH
jgi:hypothetical protein